MEDILEEVTEEIHQCFGLLCDYIGFLVSGEDYPKVTVDRNKESSFTESLNWINIFAEHIGKGEVYFEEAGHALRYQIEREKYGRRSKVVSFREVIESLESGTVGEEMVGYDQKAPKQKENRLSKADDELVQEFFGYASRLVGQRLTQDTNLAYLFQKKLLREVQDEESIKKYKQVIDSDASKIEIDCLFPAERREEDQKHFTHYVSYAIAEEFMKDNPNFFQEAKKVFMLSSREIFEEFIAPAEAYQKLSSLKRILFDKTKLTP